LKTTIRLEHIRAKTIDGMEKELLLAFTAYNMVRAVMGWAATEIGISPRALSFSQVQDVVRAALPLLAGAALGGRGVGYTSWASRVISVS
jgi:hypothetical protein